ELRVGLTDELHAEAEDSVEEDERADELAGFVARLGLPEHEGENAEQENALEECLVKLARVPRWPEHALAISIELLEADRPRHRRRSTPQLLVHEIGAAAEEQTDGRAARDI